MVNMTRFTHAATLVVGGAMFIFTAAVLVGFGCSLMDDIRVILCGNCSSNGEGRKGSDKESLNLHLVDVEELLRPSPRPREQGKGTLL
ncbi:unnamed protein product [Clonostachys rhizophaga]|uniref:Uncharacterized protein n=1 Tax=Clonostachys rhizophaga TaxID=160324 RepID=A0A9N9V9N7_9HYPO|nr:unnamed protein product [Clonostachys rhizophaga]